MSRASSLGHPGRALEDLQRVGQRVPEPLRFVAVDRRCARGQHVEVHADDWQAACLLAVAEHRDGELEAREPGLDEHRLLVGVEERLHLRHQLCPVVAEALDAHALARPLEARLREEREGERHVPGVVPGAGEDEGRRRHAVVEQDLLGRPLWRQSESESGSEAWYGMPRNSQMAGTCPSRFGP